MVITVDKLSDDPLYLQLRDAVIAGIASGELRPGDASYAHSGTSHAIENRSDRPARMLAVILKV